jgi:hypothetical protein
MRVEDRREIRDELDRYDDVFDFVEANVISGRSAASLLHCFAFASAFRPASVIRSVATSILRPPATTRSAVAVASPARTSSTSISIVKPCASRIASVAPSQGAALLDICAARSYVAIL